MTHGHQAYDDNVIVDDTKTNERMDAEVLRDAAKAEAIEHNMTLGQGWKTHKKAIFWSMALSFALIMEGEYPWVVGNLGRPSPGPGINNGPNRSGGTHRFGAEPPPRSAHPARISSEADHQATMSSLSARSTATQPS